MHVHPYELLTDFAREAMNAVGTATGFDQAFREGDGLGLSIEHADRFASARQFHLP